MRPEDGAVAVAHAEVITAAAAAKVAVERQDPAALLAAVSAYADAQVAVVAAVHAADKPDFAD